MSADTALKPRRYHELDALRAGAMLLGVFFHAAISFVTLPDAWIIQDPTNHIGAELFVWYCHVFRMPVFFLLAGFFARLLILRLGLREFLAHRIKRIVVPFIAALGPTLIPMGPIVLWGFYKAGKFSTWEDLEALRSTTLMVPGGEPIPPEITPGHLWFLYYLIAFYCLIGLLVWAGRALHVEIVLRWGDRAFAWMAGRLWAPLIMASVLAWPLSTMPLAEAETPFSFIYQPRIIGYYAVFVGFGWMLHRNPQTLESFGNRLWQYPLAFVFLIPLIFSRLEAGLEDQSVGSGWVLATNSYFSALNQWIWVLFWLGVFIRYLNKSRAWVRWLSDASYWTYILHMPLVAFFQVLVYDFPWPGPLKYALIMTSTLGICLWTYKAWVRYSFIGTWLNGPRFPKVAAIK